jgi:hypothetical protein
MPPPALPGGPYCVFDAKHEVVSFTPNGIALIVALATARKSQRLIASELGIRLNQFEKLLKRPTEDSTLDPRLAFERGRAIHEQEFIDVLWRQMSAPGGSPTLATLYAKSQFAWDDKSAAQTTINGPAITYNLDGVINQKQYDEAHGAGSYEKNYLKLIGMDVPNDSRKPNMIDVTPPREPAALPPPRDNPVEPDIAPSPEAIERAEAFRAMARQTNAYNANLAALAAQQREGKTP